MKYVVWERRKRERGEEIVLYQKSGNDNHQRTRDTALCWETHDEGKFSRKVVHTTGGHHGKAVSVSLGLEDNLSCEWADSSIGK